MGGAKPGTDDLADMLDRMTPGEIEALKEQIRKKEAEAAGQDGSDRDAPEQGVSDQEASDKEES